MFDWLDSSICKADNLLKELGLDWKSEFYQPASKYDIRTCEEALGMRLPESYKIFLQRSNGAKLFGLGDNLYFIEISGTQEIYRLHERYKGEYTDKEWQFLIPFCECRSAGGDICCFDPQICFEDEYAILDGYECGTPDGRRKLAIATSFEPTFRP